MHYVRRDPLRGQWVIVAPAQARRPNGFPTLSVDAINPVSPEAVAERLCAATGE